LENSKEHAHHPTPYQVRQQRDFYRAELKAVQARLEKSDARVVELETTLVKLLEVIATDQLFFPELLPVYARRLLKHIREKKMTTQPIATQIELKDGNWRPEARLYRLTPPLVVKPRYGNDTYAGTWEYVVVSGAKVAGQLETYIFPADENGTAIHLRELPGSFHGSINHMKALNGAGYAVVANENS
jgi:hypothetical protein